MSFFHAAQAIFMQTATEIPVTADHITFGGEPVTFGGVLIARVTPDPLRLRAGFGMVLSYDAGLDELTLETN